MMMLRSLSTAPSGGRRPGAPESHGCAPLRQAWVHSFCCLVPTPRALPWPAPTFKDPRATSLHVPASHSSLPSLAWALACLAIPSKLLVGLQSSQG